MSRPNRIAPSAPEALQARSSLRIGRDDTRVTAFLLIELRRASRTIARLREVALAARDGDAERLRAALGRIHPADLDPRRASDSRKGAPGRSYGGAGSARRRRHPFAKPPL
jgi:hypothetical protein